MSSTYDHPTESLVITPDRGGRPARARLRVIAPRGLGWQLEVTSAPLTLGRTPEDGTPPLVHGTVSRRHARLFWDVERQAHIAEDLGSRHGTHVDGAAASATVLTDGAILRLGGVFLAYERALEPAADGDPIEVSREQLPGDSYAMVALRAAVARSAADPSPALIVGDTGTGKEWVAHEMHRLSGRKGAMIAVNCAALAPQLVESQLFGHVRGAFTGATTDSDGLFRAANGGTLFLDEVGELPLELQPKLLRVLQDGMVQPVGGARSVQVEVRVVAATNRDLPIMVELNRFRRDLYARLGKWEIRVPPLSARRGDIMRWIDRLWQLWCETRNSLRGPSGPPSSRPFPEFSANATAAILAHPWPDNLRGLDRLVHELASRAAEGKAAAPAIDLDDLPGWLRGSGSGTSSSPALPVAASPPPTIPPAAGLRPPVPLREEFEFAWRELGGNVRALGRRFGRDRRQIYRWAVAYGLRPSGAHEASSGEGSDDDGPVE